MGKARTIGVAMDYSATSKLALRWAVDNLINGGDRIILINVQPSKADHTRKELFEDTGSRWCPTFPFFIDEYVLIKWYDNKLCINCFAALVPLEELRELNFTKQYGIARDPEVIDILDTVSKTKGVFNYLCCFLLSFFLFFCTYM